MIIEVGVKEGLNMLQALLTAADGVSHCIRACDEWCRLERLYEDYNNMLAVSVAVHDALLEDDDLCLSADSVRDTFAQYEQAHKQSLAVDGIFCGKRYRMRYDAPHPQGTTADSTARVNGASISET